MRIFVASVVAAFLLLAVVPSGSAHGTFEAQELEIHVLNDEGTDVMESYGGYDINEVFVGAAHHSELGTGEAGDGVYFRIEAYGHPAQTTSLEPWSITVRFGNGNATIEHTISTLDGEAFTSDFDALETSVDGVELHVARAFLLNSNSGLVPGSPITELVVETRYGNDLRDAAPGGIFVPGTNGAATYPDPTQIDGQGRLVEVPASPDVRAYFGNVSGNTDGTQYTLTIHNPLKQGGQHWNLLLPQEPGWTISAVSGTGPVEKDADATIRFTAAHTSDASTASFSVVSDVGGRLPITLHLDGTLETGSLILVPDKVAAKPALSIGPLFAFGMVALAALRRRTMN